MKKRRIYALTGLPPEVVAVTFAKCSRSPESFDVIAKELNEDKSRKFHEKWVVGYGHSSVAEHAVLSLALENVSILATKVIEDNRLASYTEKSTRYQVFDKESYYKDDSLPNVYVEICDFLFDVYNELIPKMIEFFKKKFPDEKEIEIKNKALDVCRYLLPVATLTNLGMTVNARNLEYAIMKLLSHPLKEMRQIGEELKEAALKITPTLIKYTKPNEYLIETVNSLENISKKINKKIFEKNIENNKVTLVEYDKEADNKLIISLLYRFSKMSYNEIKERIKIMNQKEKEKLIDEALSRLGKFDRPLRELEHIYYTFDILMDYGGFRDVQRHRMVTQTNQEFNIDNSYSIPKEIVEAGFRNKFIESMDRAASAYEQIAAKFPKEAQYVIPMAYMKRVLFTCNLRELFHFIKLRSGKTGHLSYRQIAWQMYDLIKEKHPLLAKYIAVSR